MISWSHSLETKPRDRLWPAVWHVQGMTWFPQAVLFWVQQNLDWGFPLEEAPAHHDGRSLTLTILRAGCKLHLFTLSFYFNKCQSLLPLWCLLIQCHYFVIVLCADVYQEGRKGTIYALKGMPLPIRINYP